MSMMMRRMMLTLVSPSLLQLFVQSHCLNWHILKHLLLFWLKKYLIASKCDISLSLILVYSLVLCDSLVVLHVSSTKEVDLNVAQMHQSRNKRTKPSRQSTAARAWHRGQNGSNLGNALSIAVLQILKVRVYLRMPQRY